MIALEQSKLGYQLKNKLLPKPLQILFHTGGEKKHHYPTRNKTLPNVQKHSGKSFDTISTTVLTVISHAFPSLMLIGQPHVYRYTLL